MINPSVKALNETKAKVAQLERALAKELASLPSAYGFNSLNEFVAALKAADGKAASGEARLGKAKKASAPKSGKRATITDATRAQVKAMVKAGKTGGAIAKALGISLPSVQNIKKALGLVKARSSKKASTKGKAAKGPVKVKAAPKAKKKRLRAKKTTAKASNPAPAVVEPAVASGK